MVVPHIQRALTHRMLVAVFLWHSQSAAANLIAAARLLLPSPLALQDGLTCLIYALTFISFTLSDHAGFAWRFRSVTGDTSISANRPFPNVP